MAFRWKASKDSRSNLRRLARDQLQSAIERLSAAESDRAGAIHEARLHLKKLRSLVRLVRKAAPKAFESENASLRDIARTLSQQRDRQAMLEAFDKLLRHAADAWNEPPDRLHALGDVQRQFVESQRGGSGDDNLDRILGGVIEQLRAAVERIDNWTAATKDDRAIEAGMADSCRRGRKTLRKALKDPSADNLHEWRKQIKYHRYHLRLFQEAWPALLEAHYNELKRLSDLLGDDHDLVLLRQAVLQTKGLDLRKEVADNLEDFVNRRRGELQAEAMPLGRLLFAEKPNRLARRILQYWRAYCDGG
jgi:CHAD domain-containing protein